jgi:hypothetical protein
MGTAPTGADTLTGSCQWLNETDWPTEWSSTTEVAE